QADGSGFSAEFGGSDSVSGSFTGFTLAGDFWTNADMAFSTTDVIGEGEVWMVLLNGTAYSYETVAGDDLSIVIDELLAAMENAPFDIVRTGDTLSIVPMAQKTFSRGEGNIEVNGQPYSGDAINAGQAFAITIQGLSYIYISGSNGDPLDFNTVGEGLKEAVEKDGVYSASFDGTTLTVNPDFNAFSAELTGAEEISGTAAVSGTNSPDYYSDITLELAPGTGSIGVGGSWTLTLNGVDYTYMVGNNGENLNIASVDVKVTDDEVPGVLITQVDGNTKVTEPTDQVVMGDGQITADGTTTKFVADFGSSVINEKDVHDSFFTAQNIDFASWSDNANSEIELSTTLPHVTIKGTGDGKMDYYTFSITQKMIDDSGGGVQAVFDIDHGFEWGDPVLWGAQLMLFGPSGDNDTALIKDDGQYWSDPLVDGAGGSTMYWDDYLTYDFTEPGDYFIRVDNWLKYLSYWTSGKIENIPTGVDYDLNISIENHDVANFQFSPSPIQEDEAANSTYQSIEDATANNTSQSIEDAKNWFTFYDKEVGNQDYDGTISSGTPYAKILGGGDGSWDYYDFNVSKAMLEPTASNVAGTQAAGKYYTDAYIQLQGDFGAGDLWTLTLNNIEYQYTAGTPITGFTGDLLSLDGVAAGLGAQLSDNYTVILAGSILEIQDENGFSIDGLTQVDQVAGSVSRVMRAQDKNRVDVSFSSADITLGDSTYNTVAGEDWSIILDGTAYTATAASNDLDLLGADLVTKIDASYGPSYDSATNTLSVEKTGGFTARVSVETQTGASSAADITISGTADDQTTVPADAATSSQADINWIEADIKLTGSVTENERWSVWINGTEYWTKAGATDTLDSIGADLKSVSNGNRIPPAYSPVYNVTTNTLTISNATAFSVYMTVEPNTDGLMTENAADLDTMSLTDTVVAGETWTITLTFNSSDVTYQYEATSTEEVAGDPQAAMAEKLAETVNNDTAGDYRAIWNGSDLIVVRKDRNDFSSGYTVTSPSTTGSDVTFGASDQIDFSGETLVTTDETWIVSMDDSVTPETQSYKATSSETTAAQMVEKLVSEINSKSTVYRAAANGSKLVIIHRSGTSFDSEYTITNKETSGSDVTSGTSKSIDLSGGAVVNGETWTIKIDDSSTVETRSDTVGASDTPATMAENLAGVINDNSSDYRATNNASELIITRIDGTTTIDTITFEINTASQTATVASQITDIINL
ncbi:hypothetical protein HOD41_00630, partial [bacterium]|nr:hypothetical protein [bacterium]